MESKIVPYVITVVVAITLVALLLIPTIDDITDDRTKTLYNEPVGNIHYSLDDGESHTVTHIAGNNTIDVDGTTYALSTSKYFIVTDNVNLQASTNGVTVFNGATRILHNENAVDVTLTISEGTSTLTYGENTDTQTYTWSLAATPDGDYVATPVTATSQVYCSSFNDFITFSIIGGKYFLLKDGIGTINGVEATITKTIKTQPDTGGTISYLEGQFTATDGTTTFTPNFVFVKASFTFVDDVGIQMGSLLAPLPVLILVALLVAGVGIFAKNRD